MHFNKFLALTTLMATASFAAPAAEAEAANKPAKPAKPTGGSQTNQCGNGAQPYCCNTDNSGLYTDCYVLGIAGVCSSTTVCCNANNSVQICLGNAVITSPPL